MASTTANTILLEVNGGFDVNRRVFEAKANAALTPGELLDWSADDELDPHGTAGGVAQKMWCVENPYIETTSAAIDTDYALGDTARFVITQPGDLVYAWLADGQTVVKGDPLESDGAGALQAPAEDATDLAGSIVGFADADTSASGARARIKVRSA